MEELENLKNKLQEYDGTEAEAGIIESLKLELHEVGRTGKDSDEYKALEVELEKAQKERQEIINRIENTEQALKNREEALKLMTSAQREIFEKAEQYEKVKNADREYINSIIKTEDEKSEKNINNTGISSFPYDINIQFQFNDKINEWETVVKAKDEESKKKLVNEINSILSNEQISKGITTHEKERLTEIMKLLEEREKTDIKPENSNGKTDKNEEKKPNTNKKAEIKSEKVASGKKVGEITDNTKRIQELIGKIEKINQDAKLFDNQNDPESIERTKLEVAKYKLQQELRNLIAENEKDKAKQENKPEKETDKAEKEESEADKLRKRMAEILGIEPYEGIENEYEHAVGYQLDDYEVDEFQELRKKLAALKETKKEINLNNKKEPEKQVKNESPELIKAKKDLEDLNRRIESEEGVAKYNEGNYRPEEIEPIKARINALIIKKDRLIKEIEELENKKEKIAQNGAEIEPEETDKTKAEEEKASVKKEEKQEEIDDKKVEEDKEPINVSVETGKIRGAILKFLRFIRSHVKDGGFIDNLCAGMESRLVSQVKAFPVKKEKTSKIPVKMTTVPEKVTSGTDLQLEDMNWVAKKLQASSKDDVISVIASDEMEKLKQQNIGKKNEAKIEKIMKKENIPMLEGKNPSPFVSLLTYRVKEEIFKLAEEKGISIEDDKSMKKIYEELERKIFQEKTNRVSKEFDAKKPVETKTQENEK